MANHKIMGKQDKISVILATGGTAGHVFPAVALARLLQHSMPHIALSVVTDKRGQFDMGDDVTPPPVHYINAAGIVGRNPMQILIAGLKLLTGFVQSLRLMRKLRPDFVIGFGGYSSLPSMFAANLLKYPTMIHEQNARLGRTNRMLAPGMNYIATAFEVTDGIPESSQGIVHWIGNPVRNEITACANSPYPKLTAKSVINIVILGGSQGALALGEKIPAALASLPDDIKKRLRVTHQVRAEQIDKVRKFYKRNKIEARTETFFKDVAGLIVQAHLLICRSGAATLAEITAIGRPAIFIPYPFAADDHQSANAARIADAGGGWIIPQSDLNSESLSRIITDLLSQPFRLQVAAECALKMGNVRAAENMAELIKQYLANR
ncbi:MAG: undecaprenyldiphospho-muramoylpentapeptide beta-N-acetylglucosaminyltransferase [Alphaproteobacteria bacterium]|nr:undecaprenyldiphospho-muramoylpentapeptide beta-N-acetylglucosaminyltransferase [Alphaproteobacteria bacterium]